MTTRVGGEVDSFCGKCKMMLAHTVLAMVGTTIARARCNTCGSDHAFRRAPGTATPSSKKALPRPTRVVLGFAAQIEARGIDSARTYSPASTFKVDELISHPLFGLGIVQAVRQDKVDVAFKAAERTLIHGRPTGRAGSASQPAES